MLRKFDLKQGKDIDTIENQKKLIKYTAILKKDILIRKDELERINSQVKDIEE